MIADAQLAATQDAGAQIALMNPGGIRSALGMPADGQLRYEDLFTVQPFSNNLVTMTLTGAQLQEVLEQQWINQPTPRILQVSRGFSYSWDAECARWPTRGAGQRETRRAADRRDEPRADHRQRGFWPAAATTSRCSSKAGSRAPG